VVKNVLLVNTNTEQMPYPVPPLGLALLASKIEPYYNVEIYDGVSLGPDDLITKVLEYNPDVIGFGIRNIDNLDIKNPHFYLDDIKTNFIDPVKLISNATLILGGSAFSLFPIQLLTFFQVKYGIKGEGEESFLRFLNAHFNAAGFDGIDGLIQLNNVNKYKQLKNFEGISALDTRLDFNYYVQRGAYSIQTKRGCSHKCIYCTYPHIEGSKFRKRDPEKVADEIVTVEKRIGPQLFEFVDSIFNDPAGYAEKICETIIERKIKSRFRTMGINPANTSDKLFTLMKQAGFVQIDCTPDSASPSIIKNLRKNFSVNELIKVAELIRKHDFPCMWFFIAAAPGETLDTFRETTDFIKEYIDPLNMVHITSGLRIFPGTELQRIAIEQQIISADDELLYPKYYFSPELNMEEYNLALNSFAKENLNFVPASESKPSPEMMAEARKRRAEQITQEPMFKTLLRIRHDWVKEGRMVVGEA
jgi:radical SAM superfamily enzyme YgiQ (UPF0313 family)